MLVFLITDENFHQQESCQESTKMGIVTKLHKSRHLITIKTNTMAPFAIYKWEQDGHFAISNKLDQIAEYIAPLGYELTYTPTESKYANSKLYVDQARNCSNTEKVTRWNTVVVDRQGNLRVTRLPQQPFTVPLMTKHGVKLLLKWLKKYLIIAKHEIKNHNFIPTLTGGLDTRTLTWFWRDLYHGPDYYLKAVKPDGKNEVTRGKEEVEIATQVLKHLDLTLNRNEKLNRVTFSGQFTEISREQKSLNDPEFIYDYIAYHVGVGTKKRYFAINRVCPFVDNLYLQLRHPQTHYMRTLLALLLCPSLLGIPLYGYADLPPYEFHKEFANLIPEVEKFIQAYDLRNRVDKLKTKVLASCYLCKKGRGN